MNRIDGRMATHGRRPRPTPIVTITVATSAASMLTFGIWARVDPPSFASFANFPEHTHFLHDAGVFQIGIGLMLIASLTWPDAPTLALAGFAVTNTGHAINHGLDLDLGGSTSDPVLLSVLTLVALIGLVARIRQLRRPGNDGGSTPARSQES